MTPAARLAQFAAKAQPGPANLDMMRLSLADWMTVGLAGRAEPVAQIIRQMVQDEDGQGPASIIGASGTQPPRAAALANGTISHALDYDDTHFAHIGHPSVAVLPAALATAEAEGVAGEAFLKAALIGVEASIRVGLWLGRSHYQAGFHQTATAGAFGATLASARLMGLDIAQTETALNLVATRASGLKSQFGAMGKPYNAGMAASNGVECAQLARLGMTAAPDGMGAAQGFGPTHHGALDIHPFDPDGVWHFDTISHKFHACCHGTHAALEALGQTLHDEVAALGIHVTNVAPGGLRTEFGKGSMAIPAQHIADYDAGVGRMPQQVYKETAGQEPGDTDKAAQAIVNIAGADNPPLHLLLGKDALGYWRDKQASMTAEINALEDVSLSIAVSED